MGVRQLQKERTRQAFMQAALDMVADDRSFTSISLREISAKVGVVPTAFYRHFPDLDSLGVAIVSTVLPALRQELKQRRQKIRDSATLVEDSVNTYFDYVLAHRKEFVFCGREITGGSKTIRTALRLEVFTFSRELADDIAGIKQTQGLSDDDIFAMADLMVRAILTTAQDLAGISQYPEAVETLRKRTIKQIQMVVIGGEHLRSSGSESRI
ncbi:hypothetical protein [Alcanivorax sp. 1008]|uniref:hypothetical protein n=1 Tax=Alcanivorax sp. 1008 TaxID=2816853 RepID=UPI001DC61B32|nr:hypothetical protein [Alcanivorax sp. 1008]MCC1497765.1 hypothetical protein [Alcanivorax sp. 1008]